MMSGISLKYASATAGPKFNAAVPQVHPLFAMLLFVFIHVLCRRSQRLYQLVFSIDKIASVIIRAGNTVAQENSFFRTGLFAKPAEDAAQHIYFIFGRIFFFAVQVF